MVSWEWDRRKRDRQELGFSQRAQSALGSLKEAPRDKGTRRSREGGGLLKVKPFVQ
jgi:hypothetical protein